MVPKQLMDVASRLKKGEDTEISVEILLSWFGATRRFPNVIQEIKDALILLNLRTEPNFEFTYLNDDVHFVDTQSEHKTGPTASSPTVSDSKVAEPAANILVDPTYRIGRLQSANTKELKSVKPSAKLNEAITLMMHLDISQLPVMTNEREVKGIIDWKSIGTRLALGVSYETVSSCMEAHVEVHADTSLFEALSIIQQNGYVLVRASDRRITGIVTLSDIGATFRDLSEPFILIGEIELYLRNIISTRFSVDELRASCDPTRRTDKINNASDLTFGAYIRLIEDPDRWLRTGLKMDRPTIIGLLTDIGKIRNDVMHFDPDGIEPRDVKKLRNLVRLFQSLSRIGGSPPLQ